MNNSVPATEKTYEPLFESPSEFVQANKNWQVLWTVEKWEKSEDHEAGLAPDEVIYAPENLLVTGGINLMLNLLCNTTFNTGLSGFTTYGSGSAVLRVGDTNTAATSGDTNLGGGGGVLGTNWDESAMDAGYPTVVVTTATWRSTFISTQGNFIWNEVSVQNMNTGSQPPNSYRRILNHKVQNFGTKASGSTWTLTLTITVS